MHERIEEAARLMAGGEQDRVERVLLGMLEERPDNARANYLMASVCDQRGQERRAVPFYRRALAAPKDSLMRTSLAPTSASAAPTGCSESTRNPAACYGKATSASRPTAR